MYIVNFMLSILVMLLVQSCGPSNEGPPPLPTNKAPEFHKVESKLSDEIEKYELSCSVDKCDKFVGMLVTQQDKMRWRCSAFFIDEDIMATAAHCLPSHLKTPGKSCENDLFIFLAQRNEPLGCKEILEVDQLSSGEFDYAFIKVDKPQERLFPISIQRQGRYNKQKIKILKVDPIKGDIYRGQISETKCELNNDSMISLYFNGSRTPQFQYSGCETVSGNSGAPILNFKNQVIGIHHSSIKPNSNLSLALAPQTAKGKVQEFGSATNFGCLCPVGDAYRRCLYYKSCRSQNNREHLLSARQRNLDRLIYGHNKVDGFERLNKSLNHEKSKNYFQWTPQILFEEVKKDQGELKQLKMYLSYRPSCLKEEWKFKDLPVKNNALVYDDVPLCELDYTLSSSLRLMSISQAKNKSCPSLKATFRLTDSDELGMISDYENKAQLFTIPRSIPKCD